MTRPNHRPPDSQTNRPARLYLSGGMEYASNEGRDWRASLQEWLMQEFHCEVFNPNHESDRLFKEVFIGVDFRRLKEESIQQYQKIVEQLVEIDCKEIAERSDIVICYWDEAAMRGAGTKGELTIARYFDKPVYMVTSVPVTDIPGWILGCTTRRFSSFDELKDTLKATLSRD